MDLSTVLGVAAVFALVLVNGFFVAAEFAIVAVRKSRLAQLAREGRASAVAAQQVVAHLDTFIAACQLGITMASLALGWVGEPAFAHLVQSGLVAIAGASHPLAEHGVAVGVSFAMITTLHIVAGELAPKGFALQRTEGAAMWVARPLQLFELVFHWPIQLLNGVGNSVLRLFGLEPASGHELVHSVEELRVLVRATQQAGGVEESEARIATRAFTFADLTAGALMTPRTELDALPADLPFAEVHRRLAASSHQRLPVYEGSVDRIVGVVHTVDVQRALDHVLNAFLASDEAPDEAPDAGIASGAGGSHQLKRQLEAVDVQALVRPAMVVPESKGADALLDEMRTTGRTFAVVIDEYGGTAGVVTIEDLVAALVGPLAPEVGTAPDVETAPLAITTLPDGSLLLDGLLRLEEWEELTHQRLDPEDHGAVETLGGLMMARLGRIPALGDEVAIQHRVLRVAQLDGMRIARVRVLTPAPDSGASGASATR